MADDLVTPKAEHLLAEQGVFKGHDGLRQLAECASFWERMPYGTRFYFDDNLPGRYLHHSVLRAAVSALDAAAPLADTIAAQSARIDALTGALRGLSFAAQTSGGTAGVDEALCDAIAVAELALAPADAQTDREGL